MFQANICCEHQISEGTYHTIVPSTEELYCLNIDQVYFFGNFKAAMKWT